MAQLPAPQYVTAVCDISRQHDKCKGIYRSMAGDQPCACNCHEPTPLVSHFASDTSPGPAYERHPGRMIDCAKCVPAALRVPVEDTALTPCEL